MGFKQRTARQQSDQSHPTKSRPPHAKPSPQFQRVTERRALFCRRAPARTPKPSVRACATMSGGGVCDRTRARQAVRKGNGIDARTAQGTAQVGKGQKNQTNAHIAPSPLPKKASARNGTSDAEKVKREAPRPLPQNVPTPRRAEERRTFSVSASMPYDRAAVMTLGWRTPPGLRRNGGRGLPCSQPSPPSGLGWACSRVIAIGC